MDPGELISVVLGSVFLAAGTAIADVFMFRGNVPAVVAGIVVLVAGYHVVHHGVHDSSGFSSIDLADGDRSASSAWDRAKFVALVSVGLVLVATGFTIGAQATSSPTFGTMVLCGACCVGGYGITHVAFHDSLL